MKLQKPAKDALASMKKGQEYTVDQIKGDWPTIMDLHDRKLIRCLNPGGKLHVPHIDHLRFERV